jgi:hypothetical protein
MKYANIFYFRKISRIGRHGSLSLGDSEKIQQI